MPIHGHFYRWAILTRKVGQTDLVLDATMGHRLLTTCLSDLLMNFGCTTKTGHPDLHFSAFLLIIENTYNVHYRCKLLIYGHQFCKAAASNFNVYAPTDRFTPSLTYFSRLQGSICKRQIFGQYIRWHNYAQIVSPLSLIHI